MGSNGSKRQAADHYTLLGLSDLREAATPEQIRKAYLKSALKYHPDKLTFLILAEQSEAARKAKKEEIDTHFKKIVAAYEVLSDPVQRGNYDSGRIYSSSSSGGHTSTDSSTSTPTEDHHHQHQRHDVDDEIPSDCAPGDFFKVFGPAFERNARWSAKKPVPGLGNERTPMEEVDKFYEFWYSFKSSRDFTGTYQYKRDREWAMRQEYIRIRRLADNAYGKDPRILRRKEEEKAEKERKKMEKKMRKEAEARAAEEERRRREEEEKRAAEVALEQKKVKEGERKLLKKERSRFRTLSVGLHGLEKDDVERLCTWFDFEKLRNVCERIEDGKDEGLMDRLAKIVSEIKREEDENKKSSTQQQTQNENESNGNVNGSVKEERPWGKEEIELLRKGMMKFPKGTPRRWEVVSEYIGTGRSVEEVLKAMKTVLLKKPDDSKAFDSFLEKRKPSKSIDSPLTTRIEVEGVSMSSTSTSTSRPPPNDQKSASGSTSSSSEQDDVWSVEQERALIQAMKTVPKELSGGARWERIAAAVPEKTANQCKKKFALLKENLRSKKSSA
ncbi:putative transcription factor MYB/SANT family [Rosa chinensis]|uniref:Putative transcription factor MYB/SANT family n=1 Tax=Rosa chinensis TaxID=74649 RepID=A0A2P6RLR2_ROSCH|nr:dnaJ homolog subfamily C member 2 [Rosa chinensis]PRQ47376.1 putative transcription factor MYB/SANT family [Rosa chinensis]